MTLRERLLMCRFAVWLGELGRRLISAQAAIVFKYYCSCDPATLE